jgi:hypothetical protein
MGTRADRRELLRMLDRLTPGDVVTVTRIDRLARSTFDLFGIIKRNICHHTRLKHACGSSCLQFCCAAICQMAHTIRAASATMIIWKSSL